MKKNEEVDNNENVKSNIRSIAFYLPQYHPIPENDEWWGKGFTEWTNVSKAQQLFPDHYQPHIPSDLGYYDLRSPEIRQAQADLAQKYGIYGFCYYHYWFNGKRLLEHPFNEVLDTGKPDFPFCLCWANEVWTRAWDGRSGEILIDQKYSREDDIQHIRWLASAFQDKRYIKINGRPLILIYRAGNLPNPYRTASIWRKEAKKLGIGDLYLCKVESFADEHSDPEEIGFDASIEFQPDWSNLGSNISGDAYGDHLVYNYSEIVERMIRKISPSYKRFPCVTPSWDNSARRKKNALIIKGATPELYETWLTESIKRVDNFNLDERIVFINAWNEWGEGNHLEPDVKFGRSYLEATKRCIIGRDIDDNKNDKVESDYISKLEKTLQCYKRGEIEMPNTMNNGNEHVTALEGILDRVRKEGPSSHLSVDAGEICFSLGLTERSKYFFGKALSLEPDNSDALNNLGVVSFQSGDLHTAGDLFNKAIGVNPENQDARQNLVALQVQINQQTGSIPVNGSIGIQEALNQGKKRNNGDGEAPSQLQTTEIDSYDSYRKHAAKMQVVLERRKQYERNLLKDNEEFSIKGYCYICSRYVEFSVDYNNSAKINGVITPNWRERVICPSCGLNSRKIACIHLFQQLLTPRKNAKIYACEQTTAVFKWMGKHYSDITGSEYLGKAVPFGTINEKGIRNEDLTALSFQDNQFDYMLSFDVFEHVPDFQKAFRESLRVLKPGGSLFFTVPFVLNSEKNIIHAVINDNNEIEHLHPPRYHGDPLKKEGCLAFYHFGWEMLDQLREEGFTDVKAHLYWSSEFGYLGCEQAMFIAKKPLSLDKAKGRNDLKLLEEQIANGENLVNEGKLDEAEDCFRKLLTDNDHAEGTLYNNLAVVHIYKGELAEAESLLNTIISKGHNVAEAMENIRILRELKNSQIADTGLSNLSLAKTKDNIIDKGPSASNKLDGCLYNQFDPATLEPLNENTRTRMNESYLLEFDFKNKTVLDIGCNLGFFSLLAARQGAAKVMGVDITEDFIRQSLETRNIYYENLSEKEKNRFNVSFHKVGFSELDPSVYRSDVVLFYEVIHWLTAQGMPISESIKTIRELTLQDLLIEFPWDVTERSIQAQTKMTREQYDAEIIFRELLKHFKHVRIIRFSEYMNDRMAKRALIHAR